MTPFSSPTPDPQQVCSSTKRVRQESSTGSSSNKRPRKSVCRRIPCKARGLSNDHNTDTAYFDVPLNAPHGLLLSCSHPECLDSGRRFRFCQVCALPVAKRNFLKRHGHGLIMSNKELKQEVDHPASCQFIYQGDGEDGAEGESFAFPTLESLYSREEELQQQQESEQASVVVTTTPPEHRRVVSFDAGSKQPPQPALSYVTDSSLSGSDESVSDAEQFALSQDEKEWLSVLYKQPDANDPSCMSTWMANMTEWMDKVVPGQGATAPTSTPALPTTTTTANPLVAVPNPLGHPSSVVYNTYAPPPPQTKSLESAFLPPPPSFQQPQPVPVSPAMQPKTCLSAAQFAPQASAVVHNNELDPVPLASPGKTITEVDFMAAINGVDFSKVFD